MKVAVHKILNANGPLTQLASTKLRIAGSLAVRSAIIKTNEALKPVNELRDKITTEKIVKNEDGTTYRPNGNENLVELTPEGQTEMAELMNTEIEIPMDMISASKLGDIEIEPSVLMQLDWLISE